MNPEQERRTSAGRATKRAEDTIGVIMATIEGRWWMADLLERCNTYASLYRNDGDALGMAFRDGLADTGRYLLAQIEEHAPDLYARMMRERRTRIEKARERVEDQRKATVAPESDETPVESALDQQERAYSALREQAEPSKG